MKENEGVYKVTRVNSSKRKVKKLSCRQGRGVLSKGTEPFLQILQIKCSYAVTETRDSHPSSLG